MDADGPEIPGEGFSGEGGGNMSLEAYEEAGHNVPEGGGVWGHAWMPSRKF